MICHDFKGGSAPPLAAAHRRRDLDVGALVQANYGDRADLCLDGVPWAA